MAARSRFIVSPAVDLTLIVGAPLVCVAILVPMSRVISTESIWMTVMALGAVGHHLPGFLRTYGDAALWRRYRLRLLAAPPLFFAATLLFALRDLHGVALVSLGWSIWHGMMQHFGFVRIYDAKERGRGEGATSARLDWLLAASWFLLCLLWSPNQLASVLDGIMRSVAGVVPAAPLEALRDLVTLGTIAITIRYVAAALLVRGAGRRVGALKLALILGTSGLVFLARVLTTDPYLSVALFELLHDVQYLTIVWAFNRQRVAAGGVRGWARVLFGAGRLAPIAPIAYVAICLAYGALGFLPTALDEGSITRQVVAAALVTSGMLHFYYDGFIWKIHEDDARRALGLDEGSPRTRPTARAPADRPRSLAHAALFAIPVILLYAIETLSDPITALDHDRAMAELVPGNVTARVELGTTLLERGEFTEATTHLLRAIELRPADAAARSNLAVALLGARRPAEALAQLDEVKRLAPDLDGLDRNSGDALAALGRFDEALTRYRAALSRAPADPDLRFREAAILARLTGTPNQRH